MVKTTIWCPDGKLYHIYVDGYGRFNSIWLDVPHYMSKPATKTSITRDDVTYVYVFPGLDDSYMVARNERADQYRKVFKKYFAEVKRVDEYIFNCYMDMFRVKDIEIYELIKDC